MVNYVPLNMYNIFLVFNLSSKELSRKKEKRAVNEKY